VSTEPIDDWKPETLVVSAGRPTESLAPVNTPIVMASNFRDTGDYSRSEGTATWRALEDVIGRLEGGACVAYSSGMAAASAIIHAVHPRAVVVPRVCYAGLRRYLMDRAEHGDFEVFWVDGVDANEVERSIERAATEHGARNVLTWIETVANPTLDAYDVPAIVASCRRHGAVSAVDATFATPIVSRPLVDGADISWHSGSKFIGGHSDLLLGLVSTTNDALHRELIRARSFLGSTPGGLEAFLALRGVRTLAVRLETASSNARILHERVVAHAAVEQVRSAGAMMAIVVRGGAVAADRVCESVRLVTAATSLGGVESTIERRQKYPGEEHVPPGLLRLSVGIENVDDLWADLHRALDAALDASLDEGRRR